MNHRISITFGLCALLMTIVEAQVPIPTVLTAPQVAGCLTPVPPVWPAPACKYQFFPMTDTVHAVASVSKTTPIYGHTYGAYAPTVLVVACPAGAILSADTKACTNSVGADASALVAKSLVPAFSIVPPPDPPPAPSPYSVVQGFIIEHSYDNGVTWDSISTSIGYPKQAGAHCFRVTTYSVAGRGTPTVTCPQPPAK